MTPVPHRVVARVQETHDTWTLELEPRGDPIRPRAGQFAMLYAFGIGEVPISASADVEADEPLTHTIRAVGAVTSALCSLEPGDLVWARGPYGNGWPLPEARGRDLVVVAGGIGLAPLRPVVRRALARRDEYGELSVLIGARTPDDLLFLREVEAWRARLDAEVDVTVDAAPLGWRGRVGLVTRLLPRAVFDAENV
ncbi:MAG: FAD/NAD(P)-binding protein, partial [Gaiellaceae bacterium]|nr:FAD/NAD(P)-binding protein [Gaiellaceae bacterium]